VTPSNDTFSLTKTFAITLTKCTKKQSSLERAKLDLSPLNLNDETRQTLNAKLVETKISFFNQSDNMLKVFSKNLSIKTLR